MFILVNPYTYVLIKISKTCECIINNKGENIQCDEEKATAYLLDDGLIYPKTLPVKMYEVHSIPDGVIPYKYLYIEGEFIINDDYEKPRDIYVDLENLESDIMYMDKFNVKTNVSKILDTILYLGDSKKYFIDKDGNASFNTLTVPDITKLQDVIINKDSILNAVLFLGESGDYFIDNNGNASFNTLDISDTLNVSSTANINGILNVETLNVSGKSSFEDDVTFKNNVYFANGTTYYVDKDGNANFNILKQNGNVVLDTNNYTTYCSKSNHTHSYAGSSSVGGAATTALACTGNSNTATTLQTTRTINGTNFNGSANITTANWGTARTITIGNKGKSVNGSGNVSWSLAEIGAAAAHSHPYLSTSGGTINGPLNANDGIHLPQGKYIYAKSDNNTDCSILGISSENNVFIGYSGANGDLDNTNIYAGGYLRFYSNANDESKGYKGQGLELYRESDVREGMHREIFCPNFDNTTWLGVGEKRWNSVYSVNDLKSSDLKEKDIIEDFDFKTKDFIMGLEPIAYRRTGVGDTGKRIHLGLGAQTLAKHINDLNIGDLSMVQASIINDDGEGTSPYHGEEIDDSKLIWAINYIELLAPMIKLMQEQQKIIDNLQNRLDKLEK